MSDITELSAQLKAQGELISSLAHRLGVAEDILELKQLHNTYGYCEFLI